MSATSARRFAARARARRWSSLRPVLIALAAAGFLGATGWVVLASQVAAVRAVDVAGTHRLTSVEVVRAADVRPGTPLLRVDLDAVESRVAELRQVAAVQTHRLWPDTVRILVTERQPVAVVADVGAEPAVFWMVDRAGVLFQSVPRPPEGPPGGMPLVEVRGGRANKLMLQAAVEVVAALPESLRRQMAVLRVAGPEEITLVLREAQAGTGGQEGAVVAWGSANDSERKATVLTALMAQKSPQDRPRDRPQDRPENLTVYNVSAPGAPSVR